LRYWEQEFTQLSPVKRRGNRRYYQHHEVLLIRRIRALLYDDGFTISGARNLLDAKGRLKSEKNKSAEGELVDALSATPLSQDSAVDVQNLRVELAEISAILKVN
jgi:DNA-binding transcriptional MerR regulator